MALRLAWTLSFSALLVTVNAKSWKEEHVVPSNSLPYAAGEVPLNDTYSGLCVVRKDETYESALWYWYFPAQEPLVDRVPTLVWLQGGPGSPSTVGLFFEHGPVTVNEHEELVRNEHTWNKHYNVLFVDSPVGTGYSYVEPPSDVTLSQLEIDHMGDGPLGEHLMPWRHQSPSQVPLEYKPANTSSDGPNYAEGYAHSREGYSADMVQFLRDFYANFPELLENPLYLTTESYGGKYVPAMANTILDYNESDESDIKIPLEGIAIGNQWTDPNTQILTQPPHAYYLGLVSPSQRDHMLKIAHQAVEANLAEDYFTALDIRMHMFDAFTNFSGGVSFFDVRLGNQAYNRTHMYKLLRNDMIKDILHVPRRFDHRTDHAVAYYLKKDIMLSTAPLFPRLLRNLKVILYQGAFDFRDGVIAQDEWIAALPWEGIQEHLVTGRKPWFGSCWEYSTGDECHKRVNGYVQASSNLTRVVVSRAGHMMPGDQPEAALDMITRWIEGYGWD